MNELRVPTVALPAEILNAEGQVLRGRIFVPSSGRNGKNQCGSLIHSSGRVGPS